MASCKSFKHGRHAGELYICVMQERRTGGVMQERRRGASCWSVLQGRHAGVSYRGLNALSCLI